MNKVEIEQWAKVWAAVYPLRDNPFKGKGRWYYGGLWLASIAVAFVYGVTLGVDLRPKEKEPVKVPVSGSWSTVKYAYVWGS